MIVIEFALLATVAVAYHRGVLVVRSLRAGERVLPRWRRRAFAAGIAVAAIAVSPPVHDLAHETLSGHMVQHVLLILIAAPLLGAGAPQLVIPRGVRPLRDHLVLPLRRIGRRPSEQVPAMLVIATVAHLLVLWLWHAPALYTSATGHAVVHALQHTTFLGTAVAVWATLLRPGRRARLRSGVGVLCIWLLLAQGALLSALLVFARVPMYDTYARPGRFGLDPLTDQQLAGLIMWLPGGLAYGVAGVTTFYLWFRAMEERVAEPEHVGGGGV